MDLSDEVSQKIKSAIRARLKESGIIWDRELPDYVMVLIANKKSKEQMEEDLNIFLGPHTSSFTAWLHNVIKKLEECAVTSKAPSKKKEEEKKKVKRRTSTDSLLGLKKPRPADLHSKNESDSEISSLSSFPSQGDLRERSPLTNFENNSNSNTSHGILNRRPDCSDLKVLIKEEKRKPRERIEINWSDDKYSSRGEEPKRDRSRNSSKSKGRSSRSKSRNRSRSKSHNRSRSSSRLREDNPQKGVSVLRRVTKENRHGARGGNRDRKMFRDAREFIRSRTSQERQNGLGSRNNRKTDRDCFDKERAKSSLKEKDEEKLPSLVKTTPRPVRPLSMQPCSNLILKAVADAQKSLAITTLPQPEDKLGIEDKKKSPVNGKPSFKKKVGPKYDSNISVTLLNDRVSSNKTDIPISEDVVDVEVMVQDNLLGIQQCQPALEIKRFTISLQSDDDSIIASDIEENDINDLESAYSEPVVPIATRLDVPEPMETNGDPIASDAVQLSEQAVHRFDRSRLGPKVDSFLPDTDSGLTCVSPSGNHITKTIVNENAFSECSETRSDENDKLIKCKFWPSCEAGDACRFYHPTTYCRTLPNCKFGQKCLYYHPPCKFGDKCLNVTCPYTHAVTTAPSVKAKVWTKVPLAPSNGQICMFFPNCTKPFCPYQHYEASGSGIPCKYGSSCTKLACEFDHPQASKNPYKWVAQNAE